MKVAIYRHYGGYTLVPETIEAARVLGERMPLAAVCLETTLEALIERGLVETAELLVSRMYLDIPSDLGDQIIEGLGRRQLVLVA